MDGHTQTASCASDVSLSAIAADSLSACRERFLCVTQRFACYGSSGQRRRMATLRFRSRKRVVPPKMEERSLPVGAWLVFGLLAWSRLGIAAEALPLVSDEDVVNTGHIVYQTHCAVCHGARGQGDGSFAPLLRVRPADLSRLAARNGGEMPFWPVYEAISGAELMPAHGSREMPIWGEAFARQSTLTGLDPATYTRGRIFTLLAWLRFIQRDAAAP